MIRRAFVVLDRDGTIIEERHYLSDPEQVALIPGAARGLRLLRDMDMGMVVATNQSGVGRGYFDLEQLEAIHARMNDLLTLEKVALDGLYFCPHHPEERCDCRKPEPGLLRRAASEHGFALDKAFVIGDKPCDIELGKRVRATTILVRTGHGPEYADDRSVGADFVADDLFSAAQFVRARLTQIGIAARLRILRERAGRAPRELPEPVTFPAEDVRRELCPLEVTTR